MSRWDQFSTELTCQFGLDPNTVQSGALLHDLELSGSIARVLVAAWITSIDAGVDTRQIQHAQTLDDVFEAWQHARRGLSSAIPFDEIQAWLATKPMVTERLHLEALSPSTEPLVHEACNSGVGDEFRFRGDTVAIDQFHVQIWNDVLQQYVVFGQPVGAGLAGLVQLYGYRPRDGTAHVAGFIMPGHRGGFAFCEALFLLLNRAFLTYPLRQIYFEGLRPRFERYAAGANAVFEVVGVLPEHEWRAGRYEDLVIGRITRENFQGFAARLGAVFHPGFSLQSG